MKVLVTGAAGFIGTSTVAALVRDGHDVVGVDALTPYYDPALKRANAQENRSPHFKLVEADIRDCASLIADEKFEWVIHLAGQPGVRASWGTGFADYVSHNITSTQFLLENLRGQSQLKKFVYASSSSIYGDQPIYPVSEAALPGPVSPYGVTKLAAEHLVSLYGKNFGVPTISLRYFTVYGPRQRPDMAFTRFLATALSGIPLPVYGDGTQMREFTFVDDLVAANLLAAESDVSPGAVVNISGGSVVELRTVFREIERLIPGVQFDFKKTVAGDVKQTGGQNELAARDLGWTPRTSLAAGLEAQYAWIRERPGVVAAAVASL